MIGSSTRTGHFERQKTRSWLQPASHLLLLLAGSPALICIYAIKPLRYRKARWIAQSRHYATTSGCRSAVTIGRSRSLQIASATCSTSASPPTLQHAPENAAEIPASARSWQAMCCHPRGHPPWIKPLSSPCGSHAQTGGEGQHLGLAYFMRVKKNAYLRTLSLRKEDCHGRDDRADWNSDPSLPT